MRDDNQEHATIGLVAATPQVTADHLIVLSSEAGQLAAFGMRYILIDQGSADLFIRCGTASY
jgi:hypothetical protein